MFSIFGFMVNFIGKRTFWRINKKDKIYLENFYNRLAGIDGDKEYAKKMTDLERKKIITIRQAKFWGSLSR